LNAQRYTQSSRLTNASLEEVQADPGLFRFAMGAGKSAFGDNCATCHGSGGQGFIGYPNLNDDIWLWGGTFDDIRHTLEVGIRAEHEETRISLMQAYGREGLLSRDQIKDLTQYVLNFSGKATDMDAVFRAGTLFQEQCYTCHGVSGTTLYNGRQGVMPNWNERLSPETITALAVYVHGLGGGVDTVDTASND